MKYEIDLFGVIVPSFLFWSVVACVLTYVVSKAIARAGLYGHVWHKALFDFALYVSVLAGLIFISKDLAS